ncbi:DUF1801 domain-containing protein [Kiritimatiellaeota bacterium B1221]|nr:DUF1801 domain-containing protein [Kiritimatiellaeota bacterium B1221]
MTLKPENVDEYFKDGCGRCPLGATPGCKVHAWVDVLQGLRAILQETALTEEIKWSVPCYTFKGRNVLILSAFKESVTLSFFRGAEMKDPDHLLEKPGENSRFARVIRFTDVEKAERLKTQLQGYIAEAVAIEESGKQAKPEKAVRLALPGELETVFSKEPDFKKAFEALTPGRQRGYLLHFSSAKQSKTKIARIQKCMPKIFDGKGWNER